MALKMTTSQKPAKAQGVMAEGAMSLWDLGH